MNERYKELARQATDICSDRAENIAWLWEEEFAKLVAEDTVKWIDANVGMVDVLARNSLYAYLGLPQPEAIDNDLGDVFNLEIARELLKNIDPAITDKDLSKLYSKCNGNPWNAPILYSMLKLAKDND